MSNYFTIYRDQKEIARLMEEGMPFATRAYSNLKGCARISADDVVWIVNVHREYRLVLVGKMDVAKVHDCQAEQRYRYCSSDYRWVIENKKESIERVRVVPVQKLVRRIRFENSATKSLRIDDGRIDHQQFRQIRQLTMPTNKLFSEAWQTVSPLQQSDETVLQKQDGSQGELKNPGQRRIALT